MKHISEIISVRRGQLEGQRQLSLFTAAQHKGSSEWSVFNTVRGDASGGYSVRVPKKPIVIVEPRRVLRIVYPLGHLSGVN